MRIVIAFFLLIFSAHVAAQNWAAVTTTDEATWYVDMNTLERKDDIIRVWMLVDLTRPLSSQNKEYKSNISLEEFDCIDKKFRTLQFSSRTENMGQGDIIYMNNELTEWIFIPPNSVINDTMLFVCNYN